MRDDARRAAGGAHRYAPRVTERRRVLQWTHLGPLSLYLALTLYLLVAVLPQFTSAIPGFGVANEDGWQNTWNLWWVRLALSRGQNPFYTDMVYYPSGAALYLHTLNITNAILTMPVQLVAGPIAAYNTAVILGFVLSGYGTFLLARHILGHAGIACVVGALIAFSPFHLSKLWDGHLSWVTVQWIPLSMFALLCALETGRWRWRVAAGALLAVAALTSWYYALFSVIFVGLLIAVRFIPTMRSGTWRHEAISLLAAGGIALVLLAPVLVPTLNDYVNGPPISQRYPGHPEDGVGWDGETSIYSSDLLDMLYPSFLHPLWGQWSADKHQQMRNVWFWTVAPGYGVLTLAAIGSWVYRRRAWSWVALALALFVLSLGPRLRIDGVNTGVPLPFDWLKVIPGMKLGHRPNHLAIFLLPIVAILAGYGMLALLRARWGRPVLAVLGGLILVEYAVLPFPVLPFSVSPAVAQLRGGAGAVLDLPPDQRTAFSMNHQMIHGRPIVGGYLAREPDAPPLVAAVPWVRELWQLQFTPENLTDIVPTQPDDAWQALSYYNIRTIILRRHILSAENERTAQLAIQRILPGITQQARDAEVDIFPVPPVATPRPFLFLGDGWMQREGDDSRSWRWMANKASITLVNPTTQTTWVTLDITAASYAQARPLALQLDATSLSTYEMPPDDRALQMHLALPPGEHTLALTSVPGKEQAAPGRDLSLAFTRVALER